MARSWRSSSAPSRRRRSTGSSTRSLPSEADGLVAAGDEASLRRAVELEPTRADAAVPLARILHGRGELDEALRLLARVPGQLRRRRPGRADRAGAGRPDAELAPALAALDGGDHERALDLLLAALPAADGARDEIRRVIVGHARRARRRASARPRGPPPAGRRAVLSAAQTARAELLRARVADAAPVRPRGLPAAAPGAAAPNRRSRSPATGPTCSTRADRLRPASAPVCGSRSRRGGP